MPEAFEELILGLTRQPGEGWGLNINNASFKVTKVAENGAASKSCDPPKVGDLLVGIAGADIAASWERYFHNENAGMNTFNAFMHDTP